MSPGGNSYTSLLVPRWALRGRVATSGRLDDDGWVLVEGERIAAVGTGEPPAGTVVANLAGALIAPGLIDVHVHGGGGHQVAGDTPEQVRAEIVAVGRHHVRHGTTGLVATTVSDTPERLVAAARGVALAMRDRRAGDPAVLGLHLEGPWLAASRAGAHSPERLRDPDPAELHALAAAAGGALRLVTFAPERPGAAALLAAGVAAGVTMSVGHTEADHATVAAAFAAGARHVTHLGNAMPSLDRRAPGPLGAALADRHATLEVIADGAHVHPGFLSLVAAVAPDRLVAVTDATAGCGMPPGRYRLGGLDVVVDGGRAVLADHPTTLAGSVLTMDRAVAGLVGAGIDVATAVRAATATPAIVAGAVGRGHLRADAVADIVVLDASLAAVATVVGGVVAWDPGGVLATLGVGVCGVVH